MPSTEPSAADRPVGHPNARPGAPPTVDPAVFCRKQQAVGGSTAIAVFTRLTAADVDPDGEMAWSVAGGVGRDDAGRLREYLDVVLTFAPRMTCARCLAPVRIGPLHVERRFRLAASERQADLEDRDAGAEEVIATSPRLSLADLIEDEAILSLPMAPAHPACPVPAIGAGA